MSFQKQKYYAINVGMMRLIGYCGRCAVVMNQKAVFILVLNVGINGVKTKKNLYTVIYIFYVLNFGTRKVLGEN
jgi:hypothetical protein